MYYCWYTRIGLKKHTQKALRTDTPLMLAGAGAAKEKKHTQKALRTDTRRYFFKKNSGEREETYTKSIKN